MKTPNIITGALAQIGVGRPRPPKVYLEKRYPLEDRTDFYKWVIVTPYGLARDFQGRQIWLDDYDRAKEIALSIRKTLNK